MYVHNAVGIDVVKCNLSMGVDDGAEEFPSASAPVHAHHAEDLEEAQAAQG